MRPGAPRLHVQAPVVLGDRVRVEDALALLERTALGEIVADERRVDRAVDDEMRDMDAERPSTAMDRCVPIWIVLAAGNPAELDRALAAIGASGAQEMIVSNDPFLWSAHPTVIAFAASKRLPAMYFFKSFTEAGGLMSYGANLEESYRRLATYVDKILKEAKPGDLPVEQPTRFELVINTKAARALGLKISQSLLLRADHVVE